LEATAVTRSASASGAATRRRRRSGGGAPLGTPDLAKLLADLGVTPITFHDVRKLGAAGAVGSLPDVSGGTTYGGALTQGTPSAQPTWNGTTLNFDGTTDFLAGAVLAALDVSAPLTIVFIADWSSASSGAVPYSIAPVGAAQYHRGLRTGNATIRTDLSDGVTFRFVDSTVPIATGMLLAISTINVAGASILTLEIPNHNKGTSAATGTLTSAAGRIVIGCRDGSASFAAVKFRAMLTWAGGYTTGQRDTLLAWAQTYHGVVLAT
jgi:hypothetical protein